MNPEPGATNLPNPAPALAQRDWRTAHGLCMARLALLPEDAVALSGLAAIAEAHDNLAQAETLLRRARTAAPREPLYAVHHARLLSMLSRPVDAADAADAALACDPGDAGTLDTLGVVFSRAERHEDAAALFARATALRPTNAGGWRNYAGALRHCGKFVESEAAYARAIAVDPSDAEAWLARVGLRRQRADDDPTPLLEALWRQRGSDPDRALRIGHALAKTAEDLGAHDAAMMWLARAKAGKAEAIAHDPDRTDRLYATAMQTCVAGDLPDGVAGPAPILVVGAPRTGTTLVDRILSSHREVVSVGESAALSLAVKRLSGTRSNRVLDTETLIAARELPPAGIGRAYIESIAPNVPPGKRSVDKMPLNLLYAGLAHRALPDAKIVRLRRHPLDAVLANWRQLFAPRPGHYDHNWSLHHLARWIVAVERLAAHWRHTLPRESYCEIGYEEIVADQEGATHRLLGFCGLDWDEACLRFHENAAPVSTASAVQVRQPLHARSVGAWRRVVGHLDPAIAVLRDAGLIDADGEPIGIAAPTIC